MTNLKNIKQADELFDTYALRKIALDARKSAHKKRIARLQDDFKEEIKAEEKALSDMEEQLRQFDTAPENGVFFSEPRKRKRANGAHGLRTITTLEYDNPDEKDALAEAESDRLHIELCKRTVTADEDLIRAALTAGEQINGVRLVTTEKLELSVRKSAAKD